MSSTTNWLDQVALDIEGAEAELRTALRQLSRIPADIRDPRPSHWTSPRAAYSPRLTIAASTARAILRGLVPAPLAVRRLRRQHIRMAVAVNNLAGHLVALNDPLHDQDATIGAAISAAAELREWTRQAAWSQATRRAGIRGWPPPISTVMQLQTPEQDMNLPSARLAQDRIDATGAGYLQLMRRRRAEPVQLSLGLPEPAVVDLRQIQLPLSLAA